MYLKAKFSYNKKLPKNCTLVMLSEQEASDFVRSIDGTKELVVSTGKREEMTLRKLVLLARKVVVTAKQKQIRQIHLKFSDFSFSSVEISPRDLGDLLAVNFEMANFEFTQYKTTPKEGWNFVTEISIEGVSKEAEAGFERGRLAAEEINACRTLANTPGGEMTPEILATAAKNAAKGTGMQVTVLGKAEMKKLGMGGVLGVAQGSDHDPKFIVMEYSGASKKEKPIVFVGKGVTFDTGGLNLKPDSGIYEMHMDMSGGAAVIHAIVLAAKLKLKKNVVALVPAVENMPSGSSYRPGDILRSMSGKTIEVLNTDAEGRIILADALTYAEKYNPELVVDVATLTGAAMGALGLRASAIFTRDTKLETLFRELGETSGDYVWPLPLWDEYEDDVKGTFGDWANTGKNRYGGAITAAMFLYQFAKEYPWVHVDMAPRMTSVDGEFLAKGAAGAPVRLLWKLLEK